jgi:MFS family permease
VAAGSGSNDWGRYGRRPIVVLALVAFIDAVDRQILPGVLTKVQDDLGFSDLQAGLLGGAPVMAGFLTVLPAGYLADRYRRTRIIAFVMASWGAISALNAVVTGYVQFLAVRTILGVGETVDNPSSASLIADYYPARMRGRAYAFQRVAPTLGAAIGLALGGAVGELFGWRWAFLLVGAPGSLLAVAVWRLREPARGEHDALVEPDSIVSSTTRPEREAAAAQQPAIGEGHDRGIGAMVRDMRVVVRIRTLRSLMIGTAIATGALSGIGFWAPAFLERHAGLTGGAASGLVGALILVGALLGTVIGGRFTDRLRERYEGAPMLVAGVTQAAGAAVLLPVFADVPLAVRMLLSVVGVMFIVAGFPALAAMVAEVVPAAIRGLAFSVSGFLSALTAALSPLLIGAVSDLFEYEYDGKTVGNLAYAFALVIPLVFVGAFLLLRGRHFVAADRAAAADAAREIAGFYD